MSVIPIVVRGNSTDDNQTITAEFNNPIMLRDNPEKVSIGLSGLAVTFEQPLNTATYELASGDIEVGRSQAALTPLDISGAGLTLGQYIGAIDEAMQQLNDHVANPYSQYDLHRDLQCTLQDQTITFRSVQYDSRYLDEDVVEYFGDISADNGTLTILEDGTTVLSECPNNRTRITGTLTGISGETFFGFVEPEGPNYVGLRGSVGGNWQIQDPSSTVNIDASVNVGDKLLVVRNGSRFDVQVSNSGGAVLDNADTTYINENLSYGIDGDSTTQLEDVKIADMNDQIRSNIYVNATNVVTARQLGLASGVTYNSGTPAEIVTTDTVGYIQNAGVKVHMDGLQLQSYENSNYNANYLYTIYDSVATHIGRDVNDVHFIETRLPVDTFPGSLRFSFRNSNNEKLKFIGDAALTLLVRQ